MPSRDKYRNNKWLAKVIRQGVTRSRYFENKSDAVKWEVEQKGLPFQEFLNGTPSTCSLIEWAEKYLEYAQVKYSAKTFDEKHRAFRTLFTSIDPTLEPTMVYSEIALKHFEKIAKERSGCRANKDRKNLVAGWNWARKYLRGWPRGENPFAECEKQLQVESPRYLPSVIDFWKVFDISEGQDRVMLLTYLHTAARRRELFNLKVNDLDFERQKIRLWTRKRKGGLEQDWIPMTDELKVALSQWLEDRPEEFDKGDYSEYVFLCMNDLEFCPWYWGKPFVTRRHWPGVLCKRAKVKPFGLHSIRHLSASILDDAGYPLTIIQGILRHKSATTTAKYLHSLRGFKGVIDGAFKRKGRPEPPPLLEGHGSNRPNLRLVKGATEMPSAADRNANRNAESNAANV